MGDDVLPPPPCSNKSIGIDITDEPEVEEVCDAIDANDAVGKATFRILRRLASSMCIDKDECYGECEESNTKCLVRGGVSAGGGFKDGEPQIVPKGACFEAKFYQSFYLDCRCECMLAVDLLNFQAYTIENKTIIKWTTGSEINNAAFRIWFGTINKENKLEDITVFGEDLVPIKININEVKACNMEYECIKRELKNISITPGKEIKAKGNERKGASYLYSIENIFYKEENTYYYLLEDINTNGDSTFHWKHLNSIIIP